MDVIRNVGVREICDDLNVQKENAERARLFSFKSMPNISIDEYDEFIINTKSKEEDCIFYQANNRIIMNPTIIEPTNNDNNNISNNNNIYICKNSPEPAEEQQECAISGRLEIRVLPKEASSKEVSPNREREPFYFDAIVNVNDADKNEAATPESEDQFHDELNIKISKKDKDKDKKKYDIKIYEDSLKIKKYKVVTREKGEESFDHSSEKDSNQSGFHQCQEVIYNEQNKDKDKAKAVPAGQEQSNKPVEIVEKKDEPLVDVPVPTEQENKKVEEENPDDGLKKNVDLGKKIEEAKDEGNSSFIDHALVLLIYVPKPHLYFFNILVY